MTDPKLPADIARSDPLVRQLNNPLSHNVRQRTTVHKHSSQLVYTAVTLTLLLVRVGLVTAWTERSVVIVLLVMGVPQGLVVATKVTCHHC